MHVDDTSFLLRGAQLIGLNDHDEWTPAKLPMMKIRLDATGYDLFYEESSDVCNDSSRNLTTVTV